MSSRSDNTFRAFSGRSYSLTSQGLDAATAVPSRDKEEVEELVETIDESPVLEEPEGGEEEEAEKDDENVPCEEEAEDSDMQWATTDGFNMADIRAPDPSFIDMLMSETDAFESEASAILCHALDLADKLENSKDRAALWLCQIDEHKYTIPLLADIRDYLYNVTLKITEITSNAEQDLN